MSPQIKIEQKTKVISEKMHIGDTSLYSYSNENYSNYTRKDGIVRKAEVEWRKLRILGYDPKIEKGVIGWGCHSVKPKDFRKVLKDLKQGVKGSLKIQGECEVRLNSIVNVVKIVSSARSSVSKPELIEKMEIVLKLWEFLFTNKKVKTDGAK